MQNLQCDWLLRMHYNTTVHAVFCILSPVFWETNVTNFCVVFIHILYINAEKDSVKMRRKKQIGNKTKTAKLNDKIPRTFAAVFADYEFD